MPTPSGLLLYLVSAFFFFALDLSPTSMRSETSVVGAGEGGAVLSFRPVAGD